MRLPELEPLERRLKSGQDVSCVLVMGGDAALGEGVVELLSSYLEQSYGLVKKLRLDAGRPGSEAWSKVAEISLQVPMFDEAYVAHVKGCEPQTVPSELIRFLESRPRHVRLVLEVAREAKSSPLAKAVSQGGFVVSSRPLNQKAARSFVSSLARELGLTMGWEAVGVLLDLVGTDRAEIASALEVLAQYKQGRGTVTADEVATLVSRTREVYPWDMEDGLAKGEWYKVLSAAVRMASDRGSAVPVAWSLRRIVQKALVAEELHESGVSKSDAMERVGVAREFVFDRLLSTARRIGRDNLKRFLEEFPDMEHAAKTRKLDPIVLATHLCLKLRGGT